MQTTPVTSSIVNGVEAVVDLTPSPTTWRARTRGLVTGDGGRKADGYGHGAGPVGRAALAAGVAELGVATIAGIRRCGPTGSAPRCAVLATRPARPPRPR